MTKSTHRAEHGTDEAFYDLMRLSGAAILKLIGFDPAVAETYQFRAIELKHKQVQRPDVEAMPALQSDDTHSLVEFQGYRDPFILRRAFRNLGLAADSITDAKPVISIVIYTHASIKKAAKPLSDFMPDVTKNPIRQYVLTDYSVEQLLSTDPRLILLVPFTVPTHLDKAELKQRNLGWTKQIRSIYTDAQEQEMALNIFGLLLLNRFRTLQEEEVFEMLNIDLMESRAVQQVYERGKLEGIQQGKQEGIQEGKLVGIQEGIQEGKLVGIQQGKLEGIQEGKLVGIQEGMQQGKLAGIQEGMQAAEQRDLQEIHNKILQVLQKRFGEISAEATNELVQFNTLAESMTAFDMAYSCESLAEFMAYCRRQ